MNEIWHRCGRIAAGGSVLSIVVDRQARTWLAAGGGVITDEEAGWRPLPLPAATEQAGLVGSASSDWWVAGLPGGLVLTWDRGRSWASAWIDQVSEPITCFAVSPRYGRDITLLAGTAGAGVLRSSDGGRRWQLSNFGLEEFTVLALAVAGDWSRRQIVFAGTADGVYRSSGGGRAWKSVGLKGLPVQCLAAANSPTLQSLGASMARAMPDASGVWTILAGTEADGLHRTLDGGFTWEPCGQEIGAGAGINALLCPAAADGAVWLTGTDEGTIWRSADNGDTWSPVCEIDAPVLALAEGPGRLLAGSLEHGLWTSADLGLTWHQDTSLCAWGFRRLYPAGAQTLAALAPSGGVWLSADAGESWQHTIEGSLYEPVLAYANLGSEWLVARAEGVLRGGLGTEPTLVLEVAEAPIVALVRSLVSGEVWAGAADGDLWSSKDEGASWQALDVALRGQRLLDLVFSPEDGTPLVGTFASQPGEVTVWRFVDGRWQRWLSRSESWSSVALAAAGARGAASWAALGGKLHAHTDSGWQEVGIPDYRDEVTCVTGPTGDGSRFLICGLEVLCSDGANGWRSLPLPEDGARPVDLCLLPSSGLLCLDAAGVVWQLVS